MKTPDLPDIMEIGLKGAKIALIGVVIYWLCTLDSASVENVIITILQVMWVM